MMDLGATVCTPRNPSCPICPLRKECLALEKGLQDELPFKPPRKKIPVRLAVAVRIEDGKGGILFAQRVEEKLLGGLWELPTHPFSQVKEERKSLQALLRRLKIYKSKVVYVAEVEHIFSHFKSVTKIYRLTQPVRRDAVPVTPTLHFAKPAELPLTTVTRRALQL